MTLTEIITPKTMSGRWDHHHRSHPVLEAQLTIATLYGNLVAKHWQVNLIAKRLTYDRSLPPMHEILAHAGLQTFSTNAVSSIESTTEGNTLTHTPTEYCFQESRNWLFILFFISIFSFVVIYD